jgi:SAM-dependent methyltransferase
MSEDVKTWHYGAMARDWADNATTGPEIAYFGGLIHHYGQPVLDAGCGTGRLLLPFLRAGVDVDGCDVSADMLSYAADAAEREGLKVQLCCCALHDLNLTRQYQTIVACGVFGIGVSRARDLEALRRCHAQLRPGGVLLLEIYMPYNDPKIWPLWSAEASAQLPWPWPSDILAPASDDRAYALHHRLVAFDPLEQQLTREMRILEYANRQVVADRIYPLTENLYFLNEARMLLETAGFVIESEQGDWTHSPVVAEHKVIVFIARKPIGAFA